MIPIPKSTCGTCGNTFEFPPNSSQCTNCWEVERRLEDYLKSENGRSFAARTLAAAKKTTKNKKIKKG